MSIEPLGSESEKYELKLIENLWIIERESGICVFKSVFNNLNESHFSSDLICGFLSAICMFSTEVFAEKVNNINLSNRTLCFKSTDHFLFVILIQKKNNINIRFLLDQISELFVYLFSNNYEQWDRNLHHFDDFSHYIEDKINSINLNKS